MSAFEDQMYPDMSKIPTKFLERAYWRRKLPPAFRFFLEMLSRELMLSQPRNVYAHAATFFEELVIQRDSELSMLPYVSYLEKLKRNRGIVALVQPYEEATRPPVCPPACIRCARCGRGVRTNPATGAAEHVGTQTSELVPAAVDPSLPRCARCGRPVRQNPLTGGFEHAQTQTTAYSEPKTLMECTGECRVIALSHKNDAFGRLPCRNHGDDKDGELVNCRSLAYLVDY